MPTRVTLYLGVNVHFVEQYETVSPDAAGVHHLVFANSPPGFRHWSHPPLVLARGWQDLTLVDSEESWQSI
jgi:hypothetical protein